MNKKSKTSEVIFAISVGLVLTFALWWIIGGWVSMIPCGADNDKHCNPDVVFTISILISVGISAFLTIWKIRKIINQKPLI